MSGNLYGPNHEQVAALIERAAGMTDEQAKALAVVWDTARDTSWDNARDAARAAAWDSTQVAAWAAAWDAVWDATIALVVRDLISPEHFDTLYGPWASVMETPARGGEQE